MIKFLMEERTLYNWEIFALAGILMVLFELIGLSIYKLVGKNAIDSRKRDASD